MRTHARAVVIGGGNMGAGVLYHLAKEGWTDCVLIEKAELTSGATWHAAGLVSRMVGGYSLGSMHDYAVDLYKRIEAETDQSVTWHGCGSLRLAYTPDELDWLKHSIGVGKARTDDVDRTIIEVRPDRRHRRQSDEHRLRLARLRRWRVQLRGAPVPRIGSAVPSARRAAHERSGDHVLAGRSRLRDRS